MQPAPQTPKRRFVSIVGLSDERRIPRLGRIRLGHVNFNTDSDKSRPEEDAFFHVPQEVAAVYGTTPTELDILFPVNDRSVVFPQAYEYYGSSRRLLCSGDGRQAMRWDSQKLTMQPTECPCNLLGEGCKQRGHLLVMLPRVRQTGVYQIDTSSLMSIININSFLHMLAPEDDPDNGLLGYFAMVPMKLRRVPRDIYPKGYHRKSYPLELVLDATDDEIKELRAQKEKTLAQTHKWTVQVPEQTNPEQDQGAIITIDGQDPSAVAAAAPADQSAQPPTATQTQPAATVDAPVSVPPASQPSDSTPQPPPATNEPTQGPQASQQTPPPPAAPMRSDRVTPAQRNRILSKTRPVQIPDQVVDALIEAYTKKQASELINQLDAGIFSAFDRREHREVPLPIAS